MRNFTLSRMASAIAPAGRCALAFWPLLVVACSVYDDALVPGATTPLGGGSGSAGASSSSAGSSSGSNSGGGAGASSSAGTDTGGTAVDVAGKDGGGTSGVGGTGGGAAGAALAGAGGEPPSEDAVLVDDMEDGDAGIEITSGRNGYWYVGNDGTAGTMEPPSNAFAMFELASGDRSAFAASLKASGFTLWGSVIGFNFVEQATVVKAYDASAFCGVRFWGKAAATTTVRFRVPDGDTHPNGNVCKDGGAANLACHDHFGVNAAFTSAWKEFSFQFADMTQTGTGYHPADMKLKTDKLYALEWALPGMGKAYQIWIDDVALLSCP